VKANNEHSSSRMSDAIYIARQDKGRLSIGDEQEIDRAARLNREACRLTPTSRYICEKLLFAN
jgi:hypothetical protein